MRKTDKKIDNQIIQVLTEVCEHALKQIDGFEWLTHTVDYNRFPHSLEITLVFDTNANLANYLRCSQNTFLADQVVSALNKINIKLVKPKTQISYDTEEDCRQQHAGNWAKRLVH